MKDIFSKRLDLFDVGGIRSAFDRARLIKNPTNLSIGQPHFDMPKPLKEAAAKATHSGFNAYTPAEGSADLILFLKNHLAKQQQPLAPEQDLIITPGVAMGIFLLFGSLLNPGDEVIVPDPYFVTYKHIVRYLGGVPVFLDTYPDFRIDADRLKSLVTPKTKAVIFSTPSNPTGTIATQNELDAIVQVASKHGLYVISDELYSSFHYERIVEHGLDPSVAFPSIAGKYERTIVLNGFSKSHSMTGWRIGYAVGPKTLLREMSNIVQFIVFCAPSVGQKIATKAYDEDVQNELKTHRWGYKQNRDFVHKTLSPHYKLQKTEGAFYSFVECPWGSGQEFTEAALKHKKLILIPGNVFSERDTHFRLSFAAERKTLEQGCNMLLSLAKSKKQSKGV